MPVGFPGAIAGSPRGGVLGREGQPRKRCLGMNLHGRARREANDPSGDRRRIALFETRHMGCS
jgi:hypothetical protein